MTKARILDGDTGNRQNLICIRQIWSGMDHHRPARKRDSLGYIGNDRLRYSHSNGIGDHRMEREEDAASRLARAMMDMGRMSTCRGQPAHVNGDGELTGAWIPIQIGGSGRLMTAASSSF